MKLGIIGFGDRIAGIFNLIMKFEPGARLVIADINKERTLERLKQYKLDPASVSIYDNADTMLEEGKPDGVLIGTRCSLHTFMALKVLRRGLPLFLEKPVATNRTDYDLLQQAAQKAVGETVVSFPLRVSPLARLAREILDSGKIGTVEHVQATNNVPYGGVYFHSWYRDEAETQGLFLQKATHDFDVINYLLGIRPVSICAMVSKRIFKGDKPAGLKCMDCPEMKTCPEGPFVMENEKYDSANGEFCCFAVDTGNEDSGSALIRYESGMHVSYSQNFFARKTAAVRSIRLLGYKGTLEFDWYSDELVVHMHSTPRRESYKIDAARMAHSGGDDALTRNFIDVVQGKAKSEAPLSAGLLSVQMCLAARKSALTSSFEPIDWNDRVV